jgi:hypothetical protein
MIENILIKIIKIIHLLLLLFILFAPFYEKDLLFKSIAILGYILYKWKLDGSCLLTKLEYYLLGKQKEEQGFIYRLINPLLNQRLNQRLKLSEFSENDFKNNLEYYTFYWFILLIIVYLIKYF